jgi:hypothetical protein
LTVFAQASDNAPMKASLAIKLIFFAMVVVAIRETGSRSEALPAPPQDQTQEPALAAPASNDLHAVLTPQELQSYTQASTLIDWTSRTAMKDPLLRNLIVASNQDQLSHVLAGTAELCDAEFRNFSRIACDEEVTSWSGKVKIAIDDYRYIVIPHMTGDLPEFEEYRTNPSDSNERLVIPSPQLKMITTDHISTFLFMSSTDQRYNRYRYFGMQVLRNKMCYIVGFAQDPSHFCRRGIMVANGLSANLLLQGFVWIDSKSYQIMRVESFLLAPRPEVALKKHLTIVDFYPVRPKDSPSILWLPTDVSVDILHMGIEKRNRHHYSNFELFRVQSTIKP